MHSTPAEHYFQAIFTLLIGFLDGVSFFVTVLLCKG
jgi:hypothetical protein